MKRQRDSFLTPLVVEIMPSGKKFKLHYDFTYLWKRVKVTVPIGFETDFASIPRLARLIIPKLGRYNKAAVVHDYIYQHHMIRITGQAYFIFTRKQADRCFRDGMQDLGVAKWKYTLMYSFVRLFGWLAWKKRI